MGLTPERWERVVQLFNNALERTPEERGAFVEESCQGDPELRQEVERLLQAHESSEDFLERPILEDESTRSTTGVERIAHFRILEKLGEGGMGTVYKAEDTQLGRTVAIKLLSGRLMKKEESRTRFLREAQAASALDHPNICTVYEVEQAENGRLAIVMAYYDGQTLRQKLGHGPLSPREALRCVLQAAQGLAAAHEAGIVHRDVKPANLMVTRDGTVKILDFGIAKMSSNENLTLEGSHLGTVNYMSPEQARGETLDQRVDIWALGVVFYELLTGSNPFRRENHLATINAILYEDPAPIQFKEGALNLWPILARALQKDPGQRYHTMGELVAALEAFRDSSDSATTLETFRQLRPAPSVAILQFKSLSSNAEDRYFSEGLTEDLAHELSSVPGLRVVSRSIAHHFLSETDPREVGRRLNVATVVEGTVRKSENRVRITAQLVNVADGFHLWSGRFDREIGDILEVQDEISRSIAAHLLEQLQPVSPQTKPAPRAPVNPAAYELYMRGRFHLNQWTPASIDRAIDSFRATIDLDGGLGPAWLSLARGYLHKASLGFDHPRPNLELALQAAQKSVSLMPERAETLVIAAVILGLLEWKWEPARQTIEVAFSREPNDPLVLGWYCEVVLLPHGRFDEALALTADACESEALLLPVRLRPGWMPLWTREPEQTIESATRCLALSPAMLAPYWIRAIAWERLGRLDNAIDSLRAALQVDPTSSISQGLLARLLALAGRRDEAIEAVRILESARATRYVAPSHLAWPYIALGEFDTAFELIRDAIDQRDFLALYLDVHPMYDPIRSDPRFPPLAARLSGKR